MPATSHVGVSAMNPFRFALRRPVTTLMLVAAVTSGGVVALNQAQVVSVPFLNTPKVAGYLDYIGAKATQAKGYIVGQLESYFQKHEEQSHHEEHKVVVT